MVEEALVCRVDTSELLVRDTYYLVADSARISTSIELVWSDLLQS